MRIAVVGQGYVGANLSRAAHEAGHEVVGIEVSEKRIALLKGSGYPVTSEYQSANGCSVVVIAVPTPLDEARTPDLSYLADACTRLKAVLSPGTLVVNESTSFPGTLRDFIAPVLGDAYLFAVAPERVDPGNPDWNVKNTPRLVSGLNQEATDLALKFYKSICNEVVLVSSPEVAEAAKLLENTFRQVNIALVNEFAQIASSLKVPTYEVIDAAATKPYGFMKFLPSVGVGGHCIPVDPSYLSFASTKVGVGARFIELANEVNQKMPTYVADRIENIYGISERTFQIAGIAYKSGVADTRESPAIALMLELRARGGKVVWNDEVVREWNGESSTPIINVEIGVICTVHPGMDFSPWKDCTAVLDVSTSSGLGWPKFL